MKILAYRPICDDNGEFLHWLNALRNLSGVYVIREVLGEHALRRIRGAMARNAATTFITGKGLRSRFA